MNYEWKQFDRLVYCRRPEFGRFFSIARRYPADLSDRFWNESDPEQDYNDAPTLVCECGCYHFTVRQAGYDTAARCVKCGLEESIHSG